MNRVRERATMRLATRSGRRIIQRSGLFLTAILAVLSMSHGAMAQGNMNQISTSFFWFGRIAASITTLDCFLEPTARAQPLFPTDRP